MSKSERWFSSPTQVFWCCDALTKGRTISHKTEIREVKGWRLGAIIHRLKSAYHWPITTELRGPENVAHYRLAPGTDSAQALADRLDGGAKRTAFASPSFAPAMVSAPNALHLSQGWHGGIWNDPGAA